MLAHNLTLALAALLPHPVPSPGASDLPFESLAQRALAAHQVEAASSETFELEDFFARTHLAADLGLFELSIPVHRLGEKRWSDAYRDVATSLLDAQARWLAIVDPGAERSEQALKDIQTLKRWTSRWPASQLQNAAGKPEREALALLGAREELVEASARLREAMLAGGGLPATQPVTGPARLTLAPLRADFVELLALVGWAKPDLRQIFWQRGVEDWLEFDIDDRKVVSLQYVALGRAAGDYAAGAAMDERVSTGIEQQVTQLALLRLVDTYFGAGMPAPLGRGLVMNIVIDLFGEIRTRIDGDLSSNVTSAREVFVPGGQSEGGVLPMNAAESRWRTEGGKDRFLRTLRQVQRSGRSSREGSRNELARFQLQSRDETERVVFSAPVLGSAGAASSPPPESVGPDYLEFLRAYQCGFMHWLQSAGGGARKASERSFAALLGGLADPARSGGSESVIAAVYERPLSDADCSPDTLEGRFLRWLSTQR